MWQTDVNLTDNSDWLGRTLDLHSDWRDFTVVRRLSNYYKTITRYAFLLFYTPIFVHND